MILRMKNTILCPICKTENPQTADLCSKCGQRFKPIKIKDKKLKKSSKRDYSSNNDSIKNLIIMAIILVIIFSSLAGKIIPNIINILPLKIVSVQGMSVTINQNSEFTLPQAAKVTMNFGIIRSENVKWKPEKIDTSVAGVKTSIGKIDGYNGEIKFNVIVIQSLTVNNIKDCTVNNSMLTLKVKIPSDTKWILINIEKGTSDKQEVVKSDNGIIDTKIYLPYGAGEYNIHIYKNTDEDKMKQYYLWNAFKIQNTDSRDMQFLLPDQKIESDSPEIVELASRLVLGLKTDREKTLAIHDFVASNIAYDTDAYYSKKADEKSALETLHSGEAVCSGYANLTAALNRAAGIKTKIIIGAGWNSGNKQAEAHAWNETFADGKWIIQDTTWDAGGVDTRTKKFVARLSHKYFDPSLSEFEKTHKKSSEK